MDEAWDVANRAAYNDVLDDLEPQYPDNPVYMRQYQFWYSIAHPHKEEL
jgi:hypothetical protein